MSEQDGTKAPTRPRKSRQIKQNGLQTSAPQRPSLDDKEAWKSYWKEQGQPWRTEPEIDVERQKYLDERRKIKPDVQQGIYPFKDIKLGRADVEWLLVTHEEGRGPVDWSDEKSRYARKGLDLRGANLRRVDLSNLPLTRIRGGLYQDERRSATEEQCELAAIHLEGAHLFKTHLEGADFYCAHLENTTLTAAVLKETYLAKARLTCSDLFRVHLEGASLRKAHLEGASLRIAHLEGAELEDVILGDEQYIGPLLADINWSNVNITVVEWSQIRILGDENRARQKKTEQGKLKSKAERQEEFIKAVRTNRQLAVVLQEQGLNEDSARFAYRAEKLQRVVLRHQRKFASYLFSGFLDLLAGYGYKPWRSFLAYLIVITTFATTYFFIGRTVGPVLSPLGSFVFSMTSFHGRGFFPGGIGLDDPLTVLAALEAFVGLLIEVTFIATLTQRLFGR